MKLKVIDLATWGLFILVGFFLGQKPLLDNDLGWHLVGGLTLLETGGLPWLDPISSTSNFWLAYSWLPEVIYAFVFTNYSWGGLQVLQTLAVMLAVVFFYYFAHVLPQEEVSPLANRSIAVLTFLPLAILAGPIWYLRPQLISLLLFALLILLAEKEKLNFRTLIPLTIIWANTHVYFLAVCGVIFIYEVAEPLIYRDIERLKKGVTLGISCFLAALVNPYGHLLYLGVFEYLFQHKNAYLLINEFQAISTGLGLVFWVYVLVVLLLLIKAKAIVSNSRPAYLILLLVFLVASIFRIKYIPLFAVVSSVAMIRVVLPYLLRRVLPDLFADKIGESSPMAKRLAVALGTVLVCMLVLMHERPATLSKERKEMLVLANQIISEDKTPGKRIVLSHFDSGGWIGFAFYLNRAKGQTESRFKVTMDGRTLVMGQNRVRQFDDLRHLRGDWCQVLDEWAPNYLFWPTGTKLAAEFKKEGSICGGTWSNLYTTENWLVSSKID